MTAQVHIANSICSTLPIAALVLLAEGDSVAAAVAELVAAAVELGVELGTELTASFPQSLQSDEPGVLMLHCLKVS